MGLEKEKRNYLRTRTELIVRYKVLDSSGEQLEGTTKDIGGGGICLVTLEQLARQTVLALEIKFPSATMPIVTVGKVAWSGVSSLGPSITGQARFDNGIEFIKISESDREKIIGYTEAENGKLKTVGWKTGIARDISK
jgi:c-di-GMP-binding flagellar brake protein YcgR